MKKRSCRLTPEERTTHINAVKIRKMTDQQLVTFVNEQFLNGFVTAYEHSTAKFLEYLERDIGSGNGIGKITFSRLQKIAKEGGFIGV